MGTLTPAGVHPRWQVSPLAAHHFPIVPSPITLYAATSLYSPLRRAALIPGFATRMRARRHTPPKQVRHPADRQFASGYSPPRLTTTQLPSATELRPTPTGTCTLPMVRPHGRTSPAFRHREVSLRPKAIAGAAYPPGPTSLAAAQRSSATTPTGDADWDGTLFPSPFLYGPATPYDKLRGKSHCPS